MSKCRRPDKERNNFQFFVVSPTLVVRDLAGNQHDMTHSCWRHGRYKKEKNTMRDLAGKTTWPDSFDMSYSQCECESWHAVHQSQRCSNSLCWLLWIPKWHSADFAVLQPIAFGASFNLNAQSQSRWSLFNGTWQKRPRELENRLRFEIEEMTLQMQ